MQKTSTTNILLILISNVLFCAVLIFVFALIMYKTGLKEYNLASYLILLLSGIFSGVLTSAKSDTKKLFKCFLSENVLMN